MYEYGHNAVWVRREDCSQLFIIVTGIQRRVMGLGAFEFIKESGLSDRNVIILTDPHLAGFIHGCSEELSSQALVRTWIRSIVSSFTHVSEVYCIGISAGGLLAMVLGNDLGAKATWQLGPRVFPFALFAHDDTKPLGTPVQWRWLDRPLMFYRTVIEIWLVKRLGLTWKSWMVPDSVTDASMTDFAPLLEEIASQSADTVHHLFYATTDVVDTFVSQMIAERSRALTVVHPVEIPPDYPADRKRSPLWDHMLVPILIWRNELRGLFPERAGVGTG